MKSRVGWIDIARGIGIIAVLYGHAISGDSYRHLLYAFHMPLFFLLSGVVFHPKKYPNFLPFIKKNVTTILVPYILFALLSYIVWLTGRSSLPPAESVIQHVLNVLYGNSNGLFFNVVLWFLPCLFVTKLIFWGITKVSLDPRFLGGTLIGVSIVGYSMSVLIPGIKLPLGLETAINATVFFGAGYLWQTYSEQLTSKFQPHAISIFIVLTLVMIVLASINFEIYGYQIDMRLNRYSNYFLYYGAAISGILATLAISMKIKKNRTLEYIGRQSLPIFVWHIIVFTYLTKFIRQFLDQETISVYRNLLIAPIFTLLAIVILLVIVNLYQKIFQRLSAFRSA